LGQRVLSLLPDLPAAFLFIDALDKKTALFFKKTGRLKKGNYSANQLLFEPARAHRSTREENEKALPCC